MLLALDVDTDAADRMLGRIGDRLDNARPLLDALVDGVHDYEREVFATGGFGAWPSLSPETRARKRGTRTLVDSGSLLEALTNDEDISGDDLTVTADVAYARFHATGTSRMPRRDPAPTPPAGVLREWAEVLLDEIVPGR